MNRFPRVKPWEEEFLKEDYDAFIAAVGYERRSRYIAEACQIRARHKYAGAFSDRKVLHFQENHRWFKDSNYNVVEVGDEDFPSWIEKIFARTKWKKISNKRICVDISSLTRFRLAAIVNTVRNIKEDGGITVDFLYSIAKFSPPPRESGPNVHVGPVMPSFAGWTLDPERPPAAVVGLGYEQDQAMGAVEHIQAADVWAFLPTSQFPEYSRFLLRANKTLLESIPRARRIQYPVDQPMDCFVMLESLTNRVLRSNCIVLFPFGSKIFSLCSLLVACLYPEIAVWRVSEGHSAEAIDRIPSEYVVGLSVIFNCSGDTQNR